MGYPEVTLTIANICSGWHLILEHEVILLLLM